MIIEFDKVKNQRNVDERGLPFSMVSHVEWDTALVTVDDRFNYGETRYIALGLISNRLYVIVFTETPTGIRVISFRKANKREVKRYEVK